MVDQNHSPFSCIEDAHQCIGMLRNVVGETQREVRDDISGASVARAGRRVEALHLVGHKLSQLHHHLEASRRILNDLRTLRRLLFDERESAGGDDTERRVPILVGHDDLITSVAFSSDGRRILTGSADHTARIWDAKTYQKITILAGHDDTVTSPDFHGPELT